MTLRALLPLTTCLACALGAQVPLPHSGLRPVVRNPGDNTPPSLQDTVDGNPVGRSEARATTVSVLLDGAKVKLDSVPGTLGRTWAYFTTLIYADFPSLKAPFRLKTGRPVFWITMDQTPRNRLFLVKCRTNRGDGNRSVKLGQAGVFTYKGINAPDQDWVIPFEAREEQPGVWRITAAQELAPGEYGFFSGLAAAHATRGNPAGELFEFGVDRD